MKNPPPPARRARQPFPGPQDAEIERIFRQHHPDVETFCRLRCATDADAADAAAEVFAVAWRRRKLLLRVDRPLAWLYGVSRKVISNQRRSNARQVRLRERLAQQPSAPQEPDGCDPRLDDLEATLLQLSELDRELIRLSTFEELSSAEIAPVLSIPPERVNSRLYEARRRLRQHLERQQTASARKRSA